MGSGNLLRKCYCLPHLYEKILDRRAFCYIELTLIQAIEAYHRQVYDGEYQSDEVYKNGLYQQFLTVIPSELDNDFKRSLKSGSLKYANQYSLRKRLKELINKLEPIGIWFLASEDSIDTFINKTCDTRNYLTHHDPELESKAILQTDELYKLSQQLQIILQVCFLKEMGFSPEVTKKLLRKIKGRLR